MSSPIFNGAGAFTLLAIVLALAAYLRQVSVSAEELRAKIKGEQSDTPYPWRDASNAMRLEKIALLNEMHGGLKWLMHILSWISYTLVVRITLFAFEVLGPNGDQSFERVLLWVDLVIAICLGLLVGAMYVTHLRFRRWDDTLRETAEVESDRRRGETDS